MEQALHEHNQAPQEHQALVATYYQCKDIAEAATAKANAALIELYNLSEGAARIGDIIAVHKPGLGITDYAVTKITLTTVTKNGVLRYEIGGKRILKNNTLRAMTRNIKDFWEPTGRKYKLESVHANSQIEGLL